MSVMLVPLKFTTKMTIKLYLLMIVWLHTSKGHTLEIINEMFACIGTKTERQVMNEGSFKKRKINKNRKGKMAKRSWTFWLLSRENRRSCWMKLVNYWKQIPSFLLHGCWQNFSRVSGKKNIFGLVNLLAFFWWFDYANEVPLIALWIPPDFD